MDRIVQQIKVYFAVGVSNTWLLEHRARLQGMSAGGGSGDESQAKPCAAGKSLRGAKSADSKGTSACLYGLWKDVLIYPTPAEVSSHDDGAAAAVRL